MKEKKEGERKRKEKGKEKGKDRTTKEPFVGKC